MAETKKTEKVTSTPVADLIHVAINKVEYDDNRDYWRERCRLAEDLLGSCEHVIGYKMSSVDIVIYEKWKNLQTISYTF